MIAIIRALSNSAGMTFMSSSCGLLFAFLATGVNAQVPGSGISLSLAEERAGRIGDLSYDVALKIPAHKSERLDGTEIIRFTLKSAARPLALDFVADSASVISV